MKLDHNLQPIETFEITKYIHTFRFHSSDDDDDDDDSADCPGGVRIFGRLILEAQLRDDVTERRPVRLQRQLVRVGDKQIADREFSL
jgi:hypothetical protein